jgi:hypothetical protein
MFDKILENTAKDLNRAWQHETVVDWYHGYAAPHELNILTRFANAVCCEWLDATSFYEVQIDHGRIDLVIVAPEAILIVEGKSTFHGDANKKIYSLNNQIERFHGNDQGIRRLIDERIPAYCKQRWSIISAPPIFIFAIAWSHEGGLARWHNSDKWSSDLKQFITGDRQFLFSGKIHHFLFKYRKTDGRRWIE